MHRGTLLLARDDADTLRAVLTPSCHARSHDGPSHAVMNQEETVRNTARRAISAISGLDLVRYRDRESDNQLYKGKPFRYNNHHKPFKCPRKVQWIVLTLKTQVPTYVIQRLLLLVLTLLMPCQILASTMPESPQKPSVNLQAYSYACDARYELDFA